MSDEQRRVDRYFDRSADYWREVYDGGGVSGLVYRERLIAALGWVDAVGLPAGTPVLEVGCGAGLAAIALARSGLAVTATDSSPKMVEQAQAACDHANLPARCQVLQADAHSLPFPAESLGLVFALGLLPWLHDPRAAVVEMARVLRPGGWMILTADNRLRLNRLIEPRENPLVAPLKPAWHAVRAAAGGARSGGAGAGGSGEAGGTGAASFLHRPEEVDSLLTAAGLTPVRRTTIGYGPFTILGRPLLGAAPGLRLHARLTELSAERLPSLRRMGWHYVVAARK